MFEYVQLFFGAFLVGVIVSAVLYGITCLQAFYYFRNYASDRFLVKLFVVVLLGLETLHAALSTYSIYYYTIINYDKPKSLRNLNWSIPAVFAQSSVAIVTVHMFYARRVYYVSTRNICLTATIVIFALANFGLHIVSSAKGFPPLNINQSTGLPNQLPLYLGLSVGLAAAIDITIAISLTYYLRKNRSGMQNTVAMVDRLIMHAISNGILTSIIDLLIFAFAFSRPSQLTYLAPYQVVSNLYTNSVLSTLNSRQSMTRVDEVTKLSFALPQTIHEKSVPEDQGRVKPGAILICESCRRHVTAVELRSRTESVDNDSV